MTDIVWEEPPARTRVVDETNRTTYADQAAALMTRPGQWAVVAVRENAQRAAQMANYIRRGRSKTWDITDQGRFEAVARKTEGEYRVYARYLKKEESGERGVEAGT